VNNLLKRLSEAYGPSGHEDRVRQIIAEEITGSVDEVVTDALGNLVAIKRGAGPKVMLAAHMDEIGVVVSYVDARGFLRFAPVGGVYTETLIGQRVKFASGLEGVIGSEPRDPGDKDIRMDKLYLDVGARDKAEAEAVAGVGQFATFWREFSDANGRMVGKAMDDRAGCAALIQVLKELTSAPNEIICVFTAQEEVGARGAMTSAFEASPRMAIAVDVTSTGDTPESKPMAVALGKGPAIKVKDRGMLANPKVKQALIDTAVKAGIPYQLEVLELGTTDAMVIQTARSGIAAGVVSVPCRYVHTPSEMIDPGDLQGAVRLLVELLKCPLDGVCA
jgi:tetrahedral aminopeptidase